MPLLRASSNGLIAAISSGRPSINSSTRTAKTLNLARPMTRPRFLRRPRTWFSRSRLILTSSARLASSALTEWLSISLSRLSEGKALAEQTWRTNHDVTNFLRCCCGCHRLQPRTRRRDNHADKLHRRMVLFITRKQNEFVHVTKLTEDGRCTKILSIDQYGFFGEGRHCEPVNMRLTKDTAPSGTAYIATVTARCQPDGPVTLTGRNQHPRN
jgi:hypothetical protein